MAQSEARARVCVFDVNETLLDLSGLDQHFTRAFGSAAVRREWFTQLLQSAFTSTITGQYQDFSVIGAAALEMTAERHMVTLAEEERQAILGGMRTLQPHGDVRESLERLREAGVRLATLSNSTRAVSEAQLRHAGLYDLFEQVLSADEARRLKPAAEAYEMAARKLGVGVGGLRLIAAHAWDIAGALHAGCAAAYVARAGMVFDPLVPRPDITGNDLRDVADQILAAGA